MGIEKASPTEAEEENFLPLLESREAREELYRALDFLDKYQREAFVLQEIEGFTPEEAARLLNERPGILKFRLQKARQRLKMLLQGRSGNLPPVPGVKGAFR